MNGIPPVSAGGADRLSSSHKIWKVHPPHPERHRIADEHRLHPVTAGILLHRGLSDPEAVRRFLNPHLDTLEDPYAYSDMEKAVGRIRAAIEKKEKILVYGDYDVDGVTGAAILYPALQRLGAEVEVYIPHRMSEGYGLNLNSLTELMKKKYRLVITVDNGITGVEAVAYLRKAGADVILIDHHTPKETLPEALAIVSAAVTGKGDANLAACGLAFKVVCALLGSAEEAREYLDLVALGTVADLAPVVGDNRTLLKIGLEVLAFSDRPGIRALFEVAGIARGAISYRDIAFGLGPRINASGRMGSPMNAFKLLTTKNAVEARNLAQILDQGNKDRQLAELKAYEEAIERVEMDPLKDAQKILVLESVDWHEGVLGIVASRLVDRYSRPAIVLSVKNGIAKGSGRSVPHLSIYDLVLRCESMLKSFGGHSQACGLTIEASRVGELRERLSGEAEKSFPAPAVSEVAVEAELLPDDLDEAFLKDLSRLEPFGPGNPKPLFATRALRVRGEVRRRGRDTLHCWMTDATDRVTCEVVGFRAYERWASQKQKKETIDILYQPSLKTYRGITSIELQLEDWR